MANILLDRKADLEMLMHGFIQQPKISENNPTSKMEETLSKQQEILALLKNPEENIYGRLYLKYADYLSMF